MTNLIVTYVNEQDEFYSEAVSISEHDNIVSYLKKQVAGITIYAKTANGVSSKKKS